MIYYQSLCLYYLSFHQSILQIITHFCNTWTVLQQMRDWQAFIHHSSVKKYPIKAETTYQHRLGLPPECCMLPVFHHWPGRLCIYTCHCPMVHIWELPTDHWAGMNLSINRPINLNSPILFDCCISNYKNSHNFHLHISRSMYVVDLHGKLLWICWFAREYATDESWLKNKA